MIEDSTMYLIIAMCAIPTVIGLIVAFLTRPHNYYYKPTYLGRWKKIPIRPKERRDR